MKQNKPNKLKPNCWQCNYSDLTGNTFFGICTWFEKNKKGPNKEIPPKVVDTGCKHFKKKLISNKLNEIVKIEEFCSKCGYPIISDSSESCYKCRHNFY